MGQPTGRSETQRLLAAAAARVQALPYAWPAAPDAASTRAAGRGSCAGKHALLAEDLVRVGVRSRPILMIGPLVPDVWRDLDPAAEMLEVHECLTVETASAGPLTVDVTWHPAAVRAGLPGTTEWDGRSDMLTAVRPLACYAVSRKRLRAQKLALRARLYTGDQQRRRDEVLGEIAARLGGLEEPLTTRRRAP